MRPSLKVFVALNFAVAAMSAACDELEPDNLPGGPDGPVTFRDCIPPDCISGNSPYVGDYPFSNVRTRGGAHAPSPLVESDDYAYWGDGVLQLADNSWLNFDYLVPMAGGRLFAYASSTETLEAVDEGIQAFFMLTITDAAASPPAPQTVPIWILGASSSQVTSTVTVWRYTIAAAATPPTTEYPVEGTVPNIPFGAPNPWSSTYYSICPVSTEENGEALFLPYVALNLDGEAAWLTSAVGYGPINSDNPSTAVIACEGQAFSKPLEFLAVMPNSPAPDRNYGIAGYNALANAYRAFYAGEPRTELGTPVYFKDLAHDPPWFDQTTTAHLPPPPILGSYEFILESAYKDVDGNGDPLGANCYYTDSNFPSGVHRLFDPPGGNLALPGWSSMTSCGATQSSWDDFGPVGAFVLKHVLPGGGGGGGGSSS